MKIQPQNFFFPRKERVISVFKNFNMKKIFILLLATALFAGCKDKKTTDNTSTDKESIDKKTETVTPATDPATSSDNSSTTTSSASWTAAQADIFISNCTDEAIKGGMESGLAKNYCSCMQAQFEKKYPNPADVSQAQMNSPEMQQMVKDCLKQ